LVLVLALIMDASLPGHLSDVAREQAEKNLQGRMEGHGAMDMSVTDGPITSRLLSGRALTSISHYFYMSVASLWFDLAIGLLVAGALSAWIPAVWWTNLFFEHHGPASAIWGVLIAPFVASFAFVCSVGNIPLAAILWRHGLGFGGVMAFIFGDLLILPILDIYRRYYTTRVAIYLAVVSYAAIVVAGLVVGATFSWLGLTGHLSPAHTVTPGAAGTVTFILNVFMLILAALLAVRFVRTGGIPMLKAMESAPSADAIRDPICGMTVDVSTSTPRYRDGDAVYYFCSDGCREVFVKRVETSTPASLQNMS
jgi:YHS domain-containing protein